MEPASTLSPGPILIDLEGTVLSERERQWLLSPAVGGVIFFARNFSDKTQFLTLVREIRSLRGNLLLSVDQEGGRVQRFREGMTRFPAMGVVASLAQELVIDPKDFAESLGVCLAQELAELDLDFSFAPVLDLDYGRNQVIGDRAFSEKPEQAIELALAFWRGMGMAGLPGVGKHFPGHGYVGADTHTQAACDRRTLDDLKSSDLLPFKEAIRAGMEALMPAHVVYPAVDDLPASRSARWLSDILRKEMNFNGVIVSDDLSMAGAAGQPVPERILASWDAGCDLLLLCNQPNDLALAIRTLESRLQGEALTDDWRQRVGRLQRRKPKSISDCHEKCQQAKAWLALARGRDEAEISH